MEWRSVWIHWAVTARWVKMVIARKFWETEILFNARKENRFIKKNDAKEDILLPIRRSSRKSLQLVGNGETVGFDVFEGEKGVEAANFICLGVADKILKQQIHQLMLLSSQAHVGEAYEYIRTTIYHHPSYSTNRK
jgi:cold shock CspA family protein